MNNRKCIETIKLVIDKDTLDRYHKDYFIKYPRRRKKPIDKPIPPSINVWVNAMVRHQANTIKQQWREFCEWLVEDYGLTNKKIERCKITWSYYFPTRRKCDNDNYVPKFLSDGLVSSGLLADDNYTIVNPTTLSCGYDKENTRTEILIEVLEGKPIDISK